eukprot:4131462-Pleurochrysis_carterae.AAC.1
MPSPPPCESAPSASRRRPPWPRSPCSASSGSASPSQAPRRSGRSGASDCLRKLESKHAQRKGPEREKASLMLEMRLEGRSAAPIRPKALQIANLQAEDETPCSLDVIPNKCAV